MEFRLDTINSHSSDHSNLAETQRLQNNPHSYGVINKLCCVRVCSTNKLVGIAVGEISIGMTALVCAVFKNDLPMGARIILGIVGAVLVTIGCACGCYHRVYRVYQRP